MFIFVCATLLVIFAFCCVIGKYHSILSTQKYDTLMSQRLTASVLDVADIECIKRVVAEFTDINATKKSLSDLQTFVLAIHPANDGETFVQNRKHSRARRRELSVQTQALLTVMKNTGGTNKFIRRASTRIRLNGITPSLVKDINIGNYANCKEVREACNMMQNRRYKLHHTNTQPFVTVLITNSQRDEESKSCVDGG